GVGRQPEHGAGIRHQRPAPVLADVCRRQWPRGAGWRHRRADAAARADLSVQIPGPGPDHRRAVGFRTDQGRARRLHPDRHCRDRGPLFLARGQRLRDLRAAHRTDHLAPRRPFLAENGRVILTGQSPLLSRHRFLWPEALVWLAAVAVYFLFPQYLAIATTVLIVALFAVSYDLAIGFGGILTLGHGLFFGIGAYCAGWIALLGWTEAVSGALASGVIVALVAAALGPFLLHLTGLPLIMVTLGISVIVY